MYTAWNAEIVGTLLHSAQSRLLDLGFQANHIRLLEVPGAFELPLGAQSLFEQHQLDGVICLGAVIKGDTPHFDFVSQACTQGILRVGLDYKKPCIFGVLTVLNTEQALARIAGGSVGDKGQEAADTLLHLLQRL